MKRIVAATIALIVGLLIWQATDTEPQHDGVQPPASTYYNLSYASVGQRLFFRNCNVTSEVDSPYWAEGYVLDYSQPVGDLDYVVGFAAQCEITLPGFSGDRYAYLGAVFLDGSGWIQKFIAPNGGRFAFLHMSRLYTSTNLAPRVYPHALQREPPRGVALTAGSVHGDENTALAVKDIQTIPQGVMASTIPGNTPVGRNGWPSAYQYSNGSCYDYVSCEGDSHLCLVLDSRAADWFESIVNGTHRKPKPYHKPKPFPIKLWSSWRHRHHKSLINAYSHHRLTFAATLWRSHNPRALGGIVSPESWHPAGRHGVDGYELDHWQLYDLIFWSRHPTWHVKWVRHRWIN